MSYRTYFSTFIINTLKPCINREQSSCKALPPLSFSCSSACFSAACSGSSVGVMPGCAIQTLTCGGAGVITGARIARSRGQPLIGAAFAEGGQVGKRVLVTEKAGAYMCVLLRWRQRWFQQQSSRIRERHFSVTNDGVFLNNHVCAFGCGWQRNEESDQSWGLQAFDAQSIVHFLCAFAACYLLKVCFKTGASQRLYTCAAHGHVRLMCILFAGHTTACASAFWSEPRIETSPKLVGMLGKK